MGRERAGVSDRMNDKQESNLLLFGTLKDKTPKTNPIVIHNNKANTILSSYHVASDGALES